MLGLRTDSGRRELKGKPVKPGPSPSPSPDGYTNLANIDWKAAGKVHAVKNQGSCGSCAAFCTASVMESMVAIKYGTPVVRLSEQHALDCGAVYGNYSCNGGWMERYFEFFSAEGAMLYSDYPYLGVDQSCQQNSSSTIAAEGD
jgi:C1A family cysteine protease